MFTLGEVMSRSESPVLAALIAGSTARVEGLAQRRMREQRRAARIAHFDTTIRDGLKYSHSVVKRKLKVKSAGGAKLAHQMKRIPA